jgi:hypothetical protein
MSPRALAGSRRLAERDASPGTVGAGLLLYCIGDASAPLPSGELGVKGGGLQRVIRGELAAVVSPVGDPQWVAAPTATELLEYERVIRAQHSVADVVPMRFGSVLSDEAAVSAHLDEQRASYLRTLARVGGCVEMGVRALIRAPSAPEPAEREEAPRPASRSGADYLRAVQRRYSAESRLREQCTALEQTLVSKVAPLCREHRSESRPQRSGEPVLCSLYFLVPREHVSAFRAALSPLPELEHAELALSGPWPPFNFVE